MWQNQRGREHVDIIRLSGCQSIINSSLLRHTRYQTLWLQACVLLSPCYQRAILGSSVTCIRWIAEL